MPDNEPNGAPAAQPTAAGQQPTTPPTLSNDPQTPTIPATETPAAPSGEQQPDVANPAAQRASQEAARYRTELKAAQARIAEFEAMQRAADEAQLSELEKAQRRIADYQVAEAQWSAERQQWRINQAIQTHAARLGVIDLDAAAKLLDTSALDFDEGGVPVNVETLLSRMLEQRPWLRGATQTTPPAPPMPALPSAGAPAAPARSATQSSGGLTRELIERMTPRDYQMRRDEVQEWLRTHPNG